MYPFVHLFGKEIPTYYLLCLSGLFAAGLLLRVRAERYAISRDHALHLFLIGGVGALLGAKIVWLITMLPQVIRVIAKIGITKELVSALLSGGYVFYGGFIGAFVGGVWYCKTYRIPILSALDLAAPAFPLFHIFGRIGCFLAGCCWGIESKWGIIYRCSVGAPNGVALFPVQLVEAGCNGCICFGILWWEYRKGYSGNGGGFRGYVIAYGICRFLLEFLRGDLERGQVGIFSTSQLLALVTILLTLLWIYFRRGSLGKTKF